MLQKYTSTKEYICIHGEYLHNYNKYMTIKVWKVEADIMGR